MRVYSVFCWCSFNFRERLNRGPQASIDPGATVLNTDVGNAKLDLKLTRRNLMSIGSVLTGTFLEGCKFETIVKNYRVTEKTSPRCFLSGTRILTATGHKNVEDLEIGDHVVISTGQSKPILWIGRRRFSRNASEDWPQEIMPVRIARGALLPNLPTADLLVSQDHRMYLHGMLIRAADLITGNSVAIDPCKESRVLQYLHIYLGPEHETIFAEGAPSETLLLDSSTSQAFDNAEQLQRLLQFQTRPQPIAPVYAYKSHGKRAMVWSHLRSAISPWIDVRNQSDKVRDLLEDRSVIALAGPRIPYTSSKYPSSRTLCSAPQAPPSETKVRRTMIGGLSRVARSGP
jgi:Hint domain